MNYGLDLAQSIFGRVVSTAPFLLILVVWELVIPLETYPLRARLKGALFWIFTLSSATICYDIFHRTWAALGMRPLLELEYHRWFGWAGPVAAYVATFAALLITDFFSYWFHRAQHSRLLWPFHTAHHSIEQMHALSSFGHPADEILRVFMVVLPASLIPITGHVRPAILAVIILMLPTYTHSPIKLNFGPLRRLFVDNRFHRIHHSTERRHYDRNFGTYFSIWDQLFGTAHFPRPGEWPTTGLTDAREPHTLAEWLFMPWRYRPVAASEPEVLNKPSANRTLP